MLTAGVAGRWWDHCLCPGLVGSEWNKICETVGHGTGNGWTDRSMRSSQIYRLCCEAFTGGWGGVMWETAKFHRRLEVSAGPVLGSGIVRGQQYWVTISAYPQNAEVALKWDQKYPNSNSTSRGVENGADIDQVHGELLNPWTFKLLANYQFNFFTIFGIKNPGKTWHCLRIRIPAQHNPLHNPVLVLAVPTEAGHNSLNPAKLQSVASGVNGAASLQGADSEGTKYVTSQVLPNSLPL